MASRKSNSHIQRTKAARSNGDITETGVITVTKAKGMAKGYGSYDNSQDARLTGAFKVTITTNEGERQHKRIVKKNTEKKWLMEYSKPRFSSVKKKKGVTKRFSKN